MGKVSEDALAKARNRDRAGSMRQMERILDDPPPYSSLPPSRAGSAIVGATDNEVLALPVFDNLNFDTSPLELPTAGQCIAHLKLLHAFARLRHDIGNQENIYGIDISEKSKGGERGQAEERDSGNFQQPNGIHGANATTEHDKDENEDQQADGSLVERIRDKRWTVFVTKAVDRFRRWWATLVASRTTILRMRQFEFYPANGSPKDIYKSKGYNFEDGIPFPPLDILMVWHAYMLNPRGYFEDCIRLSTNNLWQTTFPWKLVFDSIDAETYLYHRPESNVDSFKSMTGRPWDFEKDDSPKTLGCPRCTKAVTVPWTTPPLHSTKAALEEYLLHDTGFAGTAFQAVCSECNLTITHETLRVGRFIEDAAALQSLDRPLPGTILDTQGLPQVSAKNKRIGTHDPFFPNRAVHKLENFKVDALRNEVEHLSIDILSSRFRHAIEDRFTTCRVNIDQYKSDFVAKESKVAIRKMFGHYWDNSGPFALDLVGAVIRQAGFVQKMVKFNWIRSPAAISTMQRLIVKYHRFIRIIADNPKKIAVPTLDVDLAWHTHQLTPHVYQKYTLAETKKFLNHDDKISETSLHNYFQWTSNEYEKKYGQPYSECACWYCECTREPLRSSFTNRINPLRSSSKYNIDALTEKNYPKDPTIGVHISAHNAVTMDKAGPTESHSVSWAQQRRNELEDLDLQYAKVCKRYQKKKKGDHTPTRENDACVYGAYGYPVFMPVYVPYYAEPTGGGEQYSTAHVGGAGGCAPGTCASSASLGACAGGEGTPSCQASCGGHGDVEAGCGTCGGDGGGCGGCGG